MKKCEYVEILYSFQVSIMDNNTIDVIELDLNYQASKNLILTIYIVWTKHEKFLIFQWILNVYVIIEREV